MPGTEVSSRDEHTTPPLSPRSSPAAFASVTSGITPAPITTQLRLERQPALGNHVRDPPVRALEPRERLGAVDLDRRAPRARAGRSRRPPARRCARTSRPPASRSCTCCRARSASPPPRSRCTSRRSARRARHPPRRARSRRSWGSCAGSGSRRGRRARRATCRTFAPVASSALSNATSSPFESFAFRPSASSLITLVRVIRSIFCSPHHSSGRKRISSRDSLPPRYFFDSGGRLYGGSFSRPTRRIEPSPPSSRSQRAQLADGQPAADQEMVDRALGHGGATPPRRARATGSARPPGPRARCRARAAPRRPPRSASRRAGRSRCRRA